MLEAGRTDRECLAAAGDGFAPRAALPAGSWDTHAHVIGLAADWPFVPDRYYTPPPASLQSFIGMLDSVGLQYGVLVQISVYGTDNGSMLQALQAQPQRLRGIAVVDPASADDAQLQTLAAAGVKGIRLAEIGGGIGLDRLDDAAALCREMGWHLQLCARPERYLELGRQLTDMQLPYVLDHMAFCVRPESSALRSAILALARSTPCYVKLSAPFRLSTTEFPYADIRTGVLEIIEHLPERVLWGSDWPHVGLFPPQQPPRVGELLDAFDAWGVPQQTKHRILVQNPKELYE